MKPTNILAALPFALCATFAPAQSLTTFYGHNFPGASNWTIFFDLQVHTAIDVAGLECNISTAVGSVGSVDVYMTAAGGTHVNNESNPVWTLVGTGQQSSANGVGSPTGIAMTAPFSIQPGTYGVGLHHRGSFGPANTIGTGTNQTFSNAELTLTAGSLTLSQPGMPSSILFSPRVFNGGIFYGGFATARVAGSGCGPSNFKVRTTSRPALGRTVNVEIEDIPAAAVTAGLLVGFSPIEPGIDLTAVGMPGCTLFSNGDAVLPLANGVTSTTESFAIGNDPALIGTEVAMQALAVVFGENPLNVVLSNATLWRIDTQ